MVLARLARHDNVVKMQGMLVPLRPTTGKGGIRVDLNPTNYIQELDLGSSMIKSLSKPHETSKTAMRDFFRISSSSTLRSAISFV